MIVNGSCVTSFEKNVKAKQSQRSAVRKENLVLESELQYEKSTFNNLKHSLQEIQSKVMFLESLESLSMDEWFREHDADQSLEDSKSKYETLKLEMESSKDKLESLISAAEVEYNQLENGIKLLDDKLLSLKNKEIKLVALIEKFEKIPEGLRQKCCLDNQAGNILKTKTALNKVQTTMDSLKRESERLKNNRTLLLDHIVASRADIKELEQITIGVVLDMQQDIDCCKDYLMDKHELSGVKLHSFTTNSLTVEYLDIPVNDQTLLLKMEFKKNLFKKSVLDRAEKIIIKADGSQVSVAGFDIADLVDFACENNLVPYLVQSVKSRWLMQCPIWKEILELREQFAIDWIAADNILRVMLGDGGHIVASLYVGPNYPAEGSVILQKVEGSKSKDIQVDKLKLEAERPNMLHWIIFLKETFDK